MRTYEETMTLLKEMESRFHSGFSFSDRDELDRLNLALFGKVITKTGCSDCYRDAYVIIVNTLKKTKEMPKPASNYALKAGAIIHPFGTNKYYANPLPSDEVAEEYLASHPQGIVMFESYPTDWEARVEAYKLRAAEKEAAKQEAVAPVAVGEDNSGIDEELAALRQQVTVLKGELEKAIRERNEATDLNAKLTAKNEELEVNLNAAREEASSGAGSDDAASLLIEVETLKADLEAAKEENEKLKNDNRALKAANTRLKNNQDKAEE